jgi:hypothetical protein
VFNGTSEAAHGCVTAREASCLLLIIYYKKNIKKYQYFGLRTELLFPSHLL